MTVCRAALHHLPIRHHEHPPREIRRERLLPVVGIEDRRLPREKIGVARRELVEGPAGAAALHTLADQEQIRPGDRLVVQAGLPFRLGEAPETPGEPVERRRRRKLAQVDPRRAHVIAVVKAILGKRRRFEGLDPAPIRVRDELASAGGGADFLVSGPHRKRHRKRSGSIMRWLAEESRSSPYTFLSSAICVSVSGEKGAFPSKAWRTIPSRRSPSVRSLSSASAFRTFTSRFSMRAPICTRSTETAPRAGRPRSRGLTGCFVTMVTI